MFNWKSIIIFLRAQVGAFSGGMTDYALMVVLTEIFHIYFTISILISGALGGFVNFCINRYWAFKCKDGYAIPANKQAFRFFSIVLGSISLKSAGTYLLHLFFKLDYRIGRLLIDGIVSYGFNYPLMKFWVFSSNSQKLRTSKDKVQKNCYDG